MNPTPILMKILLKVPFLKIFGRSRGPYMAIFPHKYRILYVMVWDASSEVMLWPYMFLMHIEKYGFQSLRRRRARRSKMFLQVTFKGRSEDDSRFIFIDNKKAYSYLTLQEVNLWIRIR